MKIKDIPADCLLTIWRHPDGLKKPDIVSEFQTMLIEGFDSEEQQGNYIHSTIETMMEGSGLSEAQVRKEVEALFTYGTFHQITVYFPKNKSLTVIVQDGNSNKIQDVLLTPIEREKIKNSFPSRSK